MYILELSKVLMYELHYVYIKNKYGKKSRLKLTATDSLLYDIKTGDAYGDFSHNKVMFNFSNYSKYYDNLKKLIVGEIKDETAGAANEEFFRIKAKYIFVFGR